MTINIGRVNEGNGGSSNAQLPTGYEWRIGGTGDLELWKVDVTPNVLITSQNVGEFDVNGSLRAAINTIYLEEAHSIKSSGEEVVFKNLESNIFFTPLWQYTSENGESVGEAAILVEEPTPTDYFQNGTVDTGLNVPCVDTYTTTDNGSVYQFIVKAGEDYSGKVVLELRNSLNKAVFREERNFNVSVGQNIVFDKLLYRVRIGNVRTFSLLKSDGSVLLVKSGLDNTKPWVKIVYRGFQDRKVVHVDASGKIPTSELPQIDTVERNTVANQAARLALPVSTKFRITIQNDVQRQFYLDPNLDPSVSANWVDGGSVASAVTSFNSRTGNVTPQTGDYTASQVGAVTAPANDGARRVLIGNIPTLENIVNDLTTDSALQPLSAAQGKILKDTKQDNITGAASSIATDDLAANSVLVSDGSGKVAALSGVIPAEVQSLSGVSSNVQVQINNNIALAQRRMHVRENYIDYHGNNLTTSSVMGQAFTLSGGALAVPLVTTTPYTLVRKVSQNTAATVGSTVSIRSPVIYNLATGFEASIQFSQTGGNLANTRYFVGFSSALFTNTTINNATNLFGVCMDPSEGTYRIIQNGASGTAVRTDLGSDFPTTTGTNIYRLELSCVGGSGVVNWKLTRVVGDAGQVASGVFSGAKMPAPTVLLASTQQVMTTAASAVGQALMRTHIETLV